MQMQHEPTVPALALNLRFGQFTRDLQHALEAAVSYLELVIAPALGDDSVPPNAADDQLVVGDQYFHVFRFDPGQIELDLPAGGASIDVDRRLPQRTARTAILAGQPLDEHPLAS